MKNRFLKMESYLKSDGVGYLEKKRKKDNIPTQQSRRVQFSRPFYDTGEHILTGEITGLPISGILYNVNGVDFSYGEIIAMGDFFETVDDFMKAPLKQLDALRALMRKSRDFYAKNLTSVKKGPEPDLDWGKVVSNYYDLAEKNDSHFSMYDAAIYPGISGNKQLDTYYRAYETKQHNKSEWEKYHTRALRVSKAAIDSDQQKEAFIINAFGDHFLTDAFSAGHLFNKGIINRIFQDNFYTNGKLKDISKTFFQKVADKALEDKDTSSLFGKYEVTDPYGVDLLVGTANPNLDTNNWVVKTFKEILIGIAERKDANINGPELMGNTLIAKVAHDILNRQNPGVEVSNRKGDPTWPLTGDGNLDKKNLEMIQKAVSQSIDNIYYAPSSSSAGITDSDYVKKVWDLTPVPTSKGLAKIHQLIEVTTKPESDVLIHNTAQLVIKNRSLLIDKLKAYGIIQLA